MKYLVFRLLEIPLFSVKALYKKGFLCYNEMIKKKGGSRLSANEQYYKKTVGYIGWTILIFYGLINLFSVAIVVLDFLLSAFASSETVYTVIYQTVYAAGYLTCFMLPVAFLRWMLRKGGYVYTPMDASPRLSPHFPWILFSGIAIIFAFARINASLVSIFDYSAFSSEVLWGETTEELAPYEWVLQFIVMCVVPGFCEEFLFRGAILTNCRPFGRTNAILISSLLFALMHQNAEQILYAFAAGIFLGLVYEKTGSIWNCTLLHILNNFSSLFEGVLLEKLGSDLLGAVGILLFEGAIFLLGICSLAILVIKTSKGRPDLSNGIFGKSFPAEESYASSPISGKAAVRYFMAPSMVIFLVLCLLQIVFLILMAVLYGIFN